jgi:hypothetical protein
VKLFRLEDGQGGWGIVGGIGVGGGGVLWCGVGFGWAWEEEGDIKVSSCDHIKFI